MLENVKADLERFQPDGARRNWRHALRGMLSQGFQALLVYRIFHWFHRRRLPAQPVRFLVERFVEITTGISIPASCRIGKGFRIHHFGGIIFHPTACLGEQCTIYHGVTIGDRGGAGGAASCGDHVLIGAGAKIIGEITLGSHVIVGANAVVRESVPDGMIVVGNPATIKPRRSREKSHGAGERQDQSA